MNIMCSDNISTRVVDNVVANQNEGLIMRAQPAGPAQISGGPALDLRPWGYFREIRTKIPVLGRHYRPKGRLELGPNSNTEVYP